MEEITLRIHREAGRKNLIQYVSVVEMLSETVIEHLVGRQGQPRGAQVHEMFLSDQMRWSQDAPLPRPHLRVGSGGRGILLEIPVYLRSSEGK